MLNFISQLTYLYGICFAKLAVGASLLRIASTRLWKNLILGCSRSRSLLGGISTRCSCEDRVTRNVGS